MLKKIVLAVTVLAALSSCKKESSEELPPKSKSELLTAKEWIVEKIEERENQSAWEDIFPQFAPCLKDNRFKFKTNFTVEYNEGPVACAPNLPNQILETETWKFNTDETILITGGYENKILQLDANKLVVLTVETAGGITIETKTTYGH